MSENPNIIIKGARVNNLKNISVEIPVGKITCITGVSGSGKSSLAFDTLFAEGQRRYVESLSAYARQFLGRMMKPDVDFIEGISPAIAIEQKSGVKTSRSTVGTITEIYDYLKLLYARIGKTYSPISGKEVKRHYTKDVLEYLAKLSEDIKVYIVAPFLIRKDLQLKDALSLALQNGFSRMLYDGKIIHIEELLDNLQIIKSQKKLFLMVDRAITTSNSEDIVQRLSASVEAAFIEGNGVCIVFTENNGNYEYFSNRFEEDGIKFEEPSVNFFSFNNPYGACPKCGGMGNTIGIDENLVFPNKDLSVYDGAVAPWKGEKMGEWLKMFLKVANKFNFPIHKPIKELTEEQINLLWSGNEHFYGLNDFFKMLEENVYKIQYRVMLSRYRGRTLCPDCKGSRLRKDASYVKIDGHSITDMLTMPIFELKNLFDNIKLSEYEKKISYHILNEINSRLYFLIETGLDYLTLNRMSNSLSGGETQRINLARAIGSSLVGSMYVLDEPSIGLHPVDTNRLIFVLKKLRDLGNTVIIVEHDEDIIRESDYIIDLGPDAGREGGEVVFSGTFEQLISSNASHTAKYFNGEESLQIVKSKINPKFFIELKNVSQNNLKNIDVKIPLNAITCVTGVSGSGKSSLVRQFLYPALQNHFGIKSEQSYFGKISGDLHLLSGVEMVDQSSIGKSSRSNPATYLKIYDDIRELFSMLPLSKQRGYKPGFFSFNVEGGRCETCLGEGYITVEMQFMADVRLLCEDCGGKRFKEEVLDIKFKDKSISDLLDLTISEAIVLFSENIEAKYSLLCSRIVEKLKSLTDVGLGYLKLGQQSSTLSGGEAQRIKLASFINRAVNKEYLLFIFDEPTTGLHYFDIINFYNAIKLLIKEGHTVLIVEHNMELVKCADYIIDLGPYGGNRGGELMFQGTIAQMLESSNSFTAKELKKKNS